MTMRTSTEKELEIGRKLVRLPSFPIAETVLLNAGMGDPATVSPLLFSTIIAEIDDLLGAG